MPAGPGSDRPTAAVPARIGRQRRVRLGSADSGVAVARPACRPRAVCRPLPLPAATAIPLPAGWTTAFAALHLPDGARVLVVPVPAVHLTEAMRWQADSGQQYSLIGGYFIGPAWDGQAYIDGNGLPPTAVYLNQLWASSLRPGSPLALAAAEAGIAPPSGAAVDRPGANRPHHLAAAGSRRRHVGPLRPGHLPDQLLGAPSLSSGDVLAWRSH